MNISKLLAAIFVSICVLSCEKTPEEPIDKPQTDDTDPVITPDPLRETATVRVMYFNTRSCSNDSKDAPLGLDWPKRKQACLAMIQEYNPAVIGFNEIRPRQFTDYTTELKDYAELTGIKEIGDVQDFIFYNKEAVEPVAGTSGVFYLGPTPDEPCLGWSGQSTYIRPCYYAKFKERKSGNEFWFFVTHASHQSRMDVFKGCMLIRARIFSIVKDDTPVFIGGDWNDTPESSAMNVLLWYMANAQEIAPVTDHFPTYNDWGGQFGFNDRIYVKGNLEVLKFQTITKSYPGVAYISDHYPVVADARIGVNSHLEIAKRPSVNGSVFTSNHGPEDGHTAGRFSKMSLILYENEAATYEAYKLGTASDEGSLTIIPKVTGNATLSFFANSWIREQTKVTVTVTGGAKINGSESVSFSPEDKASSYDPDYLWPTESDKYTFSLTGVTDKTSVTIKSTMGEDIREYLKPSCRTKIYGLNITVGKP